MFAVTLCLCAPVVAPAQQDDTTDSTAVERLVRDGRVEALQSRFRGGRTPEELRLLALAATNKAARIRDDRQRQHAFKDAEVRYLTWISAAERDRQVERLPRTVNAAAARVAYAGMILSQWAVPDLDGFEISAGRRGQTRRLLELLLKARKACEQAAAAIQPLAEELHTGGVETEDHYLALGIYDAIPSLLLDIRFNLAWTNLYVGIVDAQNTERHTNGLRAAERAFQELVDSGQSGVNAAHCLLGLAMTLREQQRCDEARRYFDTALSEADDRALTARIRYERARSEIGSARFEEARVSLRPLLEKDPDRLAPEDQPTLLYVNLAHLWEANSYLEEAIQLEKTAANSTARTAVLLRAKRAREIGLRKMNELASRGGSWPALVQLFVADFIDPRANKSTLSPAELLFTARQLSEMKQYRHALEHLKEAAGRSDVPPDLAAEVLFELGVCHYRCREKRAAAEVFDRLARDYADHEKAAQAVTYAYELWATLAEQSGRREDYLRVAEALSNLLQRFPKHERCAEALWWLPVALQAAGRYQEAITHFDKVPNDSPQWEEAQFRKAMCERLLFDAERASLSRSAQLARAKSVADQLTSYARNAFERAGSARDPDAVRRWSATALVSAAELCAASGVEQHQKALELLDGFEQRYPKSEQLGRVLAVRIDAYGGLRQHDRAAEVVAQFLRTVPSEQAGRTLASVARGMQNEVERLQRDGNEEAARQLAARAISTFEQLETWVKADPSRSDHLDAVSYGLARMRHLAGQHDAARELIVRLLEIDPSDGNYQRLNALVLTGALAEDASNQRVAEAREAWGVMLRDPGLRSAVPERYWEARYHYLELMLREGRAAEVENAIRQERIWYPDLGGGAWQGKIDELRQRALERHGGATSQPSTSQPASGEPVGP